MIQRSGLTHTFPPYFPTISVSTSPLMIYFFLLLCFISYSLCSLLSRIEIGLARYPLIVNLSLQGLCANNPSLYCGRKSVSHCLFFNAVYYPLLQHCCMQVCSAWPCYEIIVILIVEQVFLVDVPRDNWSLEWGKRTEVGNVQHWSCAADKYLLLIWKHSISLSL